MQNIVLPILITIVGGILVNAIWAAIKSENTRAWLVQNWWNISLTAALGVLASTMAFGDFSGPKGEAGPQGVQGEIGEPGLIPDNLVTIDALNQKIAQIDNTAKWPAGAYGIFLVGDDCPADFRKVVSSMSAINIPNISRDYLVQGSFGQSHIQSHNSGNSPGHADLRLAVCLKDL